MSGRTGCGASRTVDLANGLTLTIDEHGDNSEGAAVLMLHGGAGPRTMAGLATALSEHVYVIAPTHPGAAPLRNGRWADFGADIPRSTMRDRAAGTRDGPGRTAG